MRCVKMNRTGEASRSTKRRCCHLWGPKEGRRHCNVTPYPARGLGAVANALSARQFGSPRRDPPCDPGGCSRDLRSTRPIGRSSRRLIEAGNTGACNAGLQCVSNLPLSGTRE